MSQPQLSIVRNPHRKKAPAMPDFSFTVDEKKFHLEAVANAKGLPKNYPYLNAKLPEIYGIARDARPGTQEYRERISSAFKYKAACRYDPLGCNLSICTHTTKSGYKPQIGNHGFIVAISTAGIDFYNQPNDFNVDLSCFFARSPYQTIEFKRNNGPQSEITQVYHEHQPNIIKVKEDKEVSIKVDWFLDPDYAHVSAVLISHTWMVFLPEIEKHGLGFWPKECRNDFILIHNPLASHPLPSGILQVSKEF